VTAPRKPTSVEVWKAIDDAAFKDEVDRVAAMSDQELEAELLKDGFDPKDLESSKNETPEEPKSKPAPVRRLPIRRAAPWLIAATLTFTLIGLAAMNVVSVVGHGAPDPAELAATLRKDAKAACGLSKWRTCLDRLNDADRLDPAGASETQALRKKAEDELHAQPER
jgi:hypothetical protein